ncbi:MAG: hypothetical protein JWP47_923 [Polaromonas sp.]|nr:hypothetical protein [Polaromonas sp.]
MSATLSTGAFAREAVANEFININEQSSVGYWLTTLECSEYELRMAVAEVGAVARDVGIELGKAV